MSGTEALLQCVWITAARKRKIPEESISRQSSPLTRRRGYSKYRFICLPLGTPSLGIRLMETDNIHLYLLTKAHMWASSSHTGNSP